MAWFPVEPLAAHRFLTDMSTPDDLALFAFECRRMAAESRNPAERLDWLRLAESWDRMREREQAGVGHGAAENPALSRPAFALWA